MKMVKKPGLDIFISFYFIIIIIFLSRWPVFCPVEKWPEF